MRRAFRGLMLLVLGMGLGGAATFVAFRHHAVRADDGWHVVPSGVAAPTQCVVDARGWTADDWAKHPQIVAALVEAGDGNVVLKTAAAGLADRILHR